jgi:hypothetical protein
MSLLLAMSGRLHAMTNEDVVKMTEADFAAETIILAIEKEPADYRTDTDALIELKKAGVAEKVIQKMVAAQHRAAQPAEAAPAAPSAEPEPAGKFARQTFPGIAPPMIDPAAGKKYFLRSTMHFEDGEYAATNYARGAIVPINTPVQIVSMRGKKIGIKRLDTGEALQIENVDKYTLKSLAELARLLFSDVPTPIERLPDELAASIRNGDMRKGMTKELVLMARGYPPAHETSSIESDRWVYWSSRFVKHTVIFADGRLAEGRGLF